MIDELEHAKNLIDRAIDEYTRYSSTIDATKREPAIQELLDKLFEVEDAYKEYCTELDDNFSDEGVSIYESDGGISIEFYLEAEQWHSISKLLRRLRND